MLKVEKKGNEFQNSVIESIPNVGQFWTLSPEAYLAQPPLAGTKGKWATP